MKAVFVVGFHNSVLAELRRGFSIEFANQSLLWIPICAWSPHQDGDVQNFKDLLFDRLAAGVTEILVLAVVRRGRDDFHRELLEVMSLGLRRHGQDIIKAPELQPFKDAHYSTSELIESISRFFGLRRPSVVLPESLNELAAWSSQELDGKLLILPRAINAAKKSGFEDPTLVYRSLVLLGNEYRDTRLAHGPEAQRKCQKRCNELGVQITRSISACRAGEQGDQYLVTYPCEGSNRFLDWHLKKGTTKDDRLCLRIYFFWDLRVKLVVVGWLPSHLDTRST